MLEGLVGALGSIVVEQESILPRQFKTVLSLTETVSGREVKSDIGEVRFLTMQACAVSWAIKAHYLFFAREY
jgi:hypothetical protein